MLKAAAEHGISGVMPWAWGGEGRPRVAGGYWRAGDDVIGDPPHEPQGWYSVFATDESTLRVLSAGMQDVRAVPPTPPWPPLPPLPPPVAPSPPVCHSSEAGDAQSMMCESWCADGSHCAFCKCRGCAALHCPAYAMSPALPPSPRHVVCHPTLPDDLDYQGCETWCDPSRFESHCDFCKCRGCAGCPADRALHVKP